MMQASRQRLQCGWRAYSSGIPGDQGLFDFANVAGGPRYVIDGVSSDAFRIKERQTEKKIIHRGSLILLPKQILPWRPLNPQELTVLQCLSQLSDRRLMLERFFVT